jgi:hypothetical protein
MTETDGVWNGYPRGFRYPFGYHAASELRNQPCNKILQFSKQLAADDLPLYEICPLRHPKPEG